MDDELDPPIGVYYPDAALRETAQEHPGRFRVTGPVQMPEVQLRRTNQDRLWGHPPDPDEIQALRAVKRDMLKAAYGMPLLPDRVEELTSETEKGMGTIESAQERLRVALREFAGLQSLMDRFSGQEPPVGTVLRWTKQFDGNSGELVLDEAAMRTSDQLGRSIRFQVTTPTEYTYLAFRAPNGDWFTTAQRGAHRYEWTDLLRDIGDNPCEIATDWTEVPAPPKVEESRLDPVTWARQMFSVRADVSDEDTSQ